MIDNEEELCLVGHFNDSVRYSYSSPRNYYGWLSDSKSTRSFIVNRDFDKYSLTII